MPDSNPICDIAMLVHSLDDRAVSRFNLTLTSMLADRGLGVSLICARRDPRNGLPVHPKVRVVDLEVGSRPTVFAVPRLVRALRDLRPRVVFAHGNGPNRAAVLARGLSRVRTGLVLVEHNHYATFFEGRRGLRDRLTALLYPRADGVAGVSPAITAEIEQRIPRLRGRTRVLHPAGPSLKGLVDASPPMPDHPWYGKPHGPRVVCSVANLVPRKGQHVLVQALPQVRDQIGDVRLVLVGRPDDRPYVDGLKRLAENLGVAEYVSFAGYQDAPLPWIAHADVFALASLTEGCPTVLIEAVALGVPAVAADAAGGASYALDSGNAGVLVAPDDPDSTAEGLIRVLNDDELRTRVVGSGREWANRFDPEQVVDDYLAVAKACCDVSLGGPR